MNLPETVKVGNHKFKVDTSAAALRDLHDEGYSGSLRFERLKIEIDPDRPASQLAETLVHEILHACWHCSGMNEYRSEEELEEMAVTVLAPLVAGAIAGNPDAIKFIQSAMR